ncbi:MAG: hypothetical protein V3S89_14865 [Desulfobacterales bacterium]
MTREETIQMFLDRVLNWDREGILDLANLLYDLDYAITYAWDGGLDCWRKTGEALDDYLDLGVLPGQDPATASPSEQIWAKDKKGNCLTSLDFESTDHGHVFNHMIRSIDCLQPRK